MVAGAVFSVLRVKGKAYVFMHQSCCFDWPGDLYLMQLFQCHSVFRV